MSKAEQIGLTSRQIKSFIDDGFVKIEDAYSTDLAKRCRNDLWADIGLSPDNPESWTEPVIRRRSKSSPPFIEAANSARLHQAYDQLAGEDGGSRLKDWEPSRSVFHHRNRPATMAGTWI